MKSLFNRRNNGQNNNREHKSNPSTSIQKIGGTQSLILESRPANLPAKNPHEEDSHRRQHDAIVEQIKRRETEEQKMKQRRIEERLKEEEKVAQDLKIWTQHIIPNFKNWRDTKSIYDLWGRGLPPPIRGQIWRLAITNRLNISSNVYRDCLKKKSTCKSEFLTAIKLDVSRTFPTLCIFQDGGPLFETLHSILAVFCIFRPEIGYIQGMSFIGAILTLNMESHDAFVCFANLLDNPCHKAAFTLDQHQMDLYFRIYVDSLSFNLPKVYEHFIQVGLSPNFYLLEWIYTIYAKAMPLDVACRVWDIFIRDGDEFLFKCAIGILHLYQTELLTMDFVRGAQFLIKLPDSLLSSDLFRSINQISFNFGELTFQQMVTNSS